jgi:hypothetical protein
MAGVVKLLEECSPPSLVRMNIDGVARFAILGKHSNAFIPALAVIESQCELFNLSGEFGFSHQYDGVAALDFGSDFILKPSYAAACEIDKGELFQTPGAVVRTKDSDYLVAAAPWRRGPAYCDIKTGDCKGEQGGARVAFAAWALFTPDDQKRPLIELNLRKSD